MAMSSIDPQSNTPRWIQIADILRERITAQGAGLTGLSDAALAREFGVSPLTVRQAVQELVRRGLVTRHRGRGTFVVAKPERGSVDHFAATLDGWRVQGDDVRIDVLERSLRVANMAVAAALQVPPGERVGYVRRLRHADGHPVSVDERYLLERIHAGLDVEDLKTEMVWEVLETRLGIATRQSNSTIRAILAPAPAAALLGIATDTPVLSREILLIGDNGTPIMTGHTIYHPDRFIYATTVRRPS